MFIRSLICVCFGGYLFEKVFVKVKQERLSLTAGNLSNLVEALSYTSLCLVNTLLLQVK